MTEAIGPIFAAGFQTVTKGGYPLLFLPDANNDALQREGKPPVYHWLPNTVRLARKDNGDYKFSFLHFVGVRNETTNVGVVGTQEVAGALVGFSTTTSPPPEVLQEACDDLINRFRGSDDYYWGWRSPATPMFRPAPIVANTVSITPIAPLPDGSMPTTTPDPGAGGGVAPAGGPPNRAASNGAPLVRLAQRPPLIVSPRTYPVSRAARASNLDAWYCNLKGEGPGSISAVRRECLSPVWSVAYPPHIIWQLPRRELADLRDAAPEVESLEPGLRDPYPWRLVAHPGSFLRRRACRRSVLVGRPQGRVQHMRQRARSGRDPGDSTLPNAERSRSRWRSART